MITNRSIRKIGYAALGVSLLLTAVLGWGVGHAQIPISNLPNASLPLTGAEQTIVNQVGVTKKTTVSSFGGLFPPLNATYILQSPNAGIPNSRTLVGTANEILLADGGPLGNLVLSTPQPIATTSTPTFAGMTLTGALTGTSANFSGALSANSLSLTTPLPATSGGTGFGSYAIGDLLSASTTTALSRVPDVAVGSYLRSGGVATLPLWSTLTLPNAATTGDLLMATGANAVGVRADVAAGSYLRSGGVGAAPVYSTTTIPNTSVLGDIWYGSAANVVSALPGSIIVSKQFLVQVGTGVISAAPAWGGIAASDLPGSFSGFANPTGTIGLTAVNGAATTAPRSDSAPALSQAIVPTWSGIHTFSAIPNFNAGFAGTFNQNTAIQSALTNTSVGVAADTAIGISNNTNSALMGITGINNVTPHWTGGPASSHMYLGASGNIPLSIGTNSIERINITGAGLVKNFEPNFGAAAERNTATYETGSFTGTLTGMTAGTSGTITYTRSGNIVFLEGPNAGLIGTSNTTAMTMTGLPASITPVANLKMPCTGITNAGGGDTAAQCFVLTTNQVAFSLLNIATGTYTGLFTASSSKGLSGGWTMSYPLQ